MKIIYILDTSWSQQNWLRQDGHIRHFQTHKFVFWSDNDLIMFFAADEDYLFGADVSIKKQKVSPSSRASLLYSFVSYICIFI